MTNLKRMIFIALGLFLGMLLLSQCLPTVKKPAPYRTAM